VIMQIVSDFKYKFEN